MKFKPFFRIKAASFFLVLMVGYSQAQNYVEKKAVTIDLSYHQTNDEVPVLKVLTKSKIGKKFKPVENVAVNLFAGEETTQGFLGRITTNKEGAGALTISSIAWLAWDSLSVMKFIATVTASDRFEDASTEIEITKARIELSLSEEDSVRTMQATLFAKQDTGWVEVPDTELKFVVKRYFSDLPVSEEASTTDEKGSASSEFYLILPGDHNGDIFVGAKIEDNETYGNLQATKMVNWGTHFVEDKSFNFDERSLWATRNKTPLWLLIFPNLIIAAVWGFIFYLVYLILRIRKIGMEKQE